MLSKNTKIYAGCHPNDEAVVAQTLERLRSAGWADVSVLSLLTDQTASLEMIQQSGMVLLFLSISFARDNG